MSNFVPRVGSIEFKRLTFSQQLEIKALQLFNQEEYERITGKNVSNTSDVLKSVLPSDLTQPPPKYIDLPVSFVRGFWSVYLTNFKISWYSNLLDNPLDDFRVRYKNVCNSHAFTFPLVSVESTYYWILEWICKSFYKSCITLDTLIDACKVYVCLSRSLELESLKNKLSKHAMYKDDPEFKRFYDADLFYQKSMIELRDVSSIDEVNELFFMVESPADELDYLLIEDCVIFKKAKNLDGRWFYPLIPSGLFYSGNFSIRGWGLI